MKKLRNSQGSFKPVKIITLVFVLLFIFATLSFAYYKATYTESAHGDAVNRSSIASFGYAIGNCAHCHEQHASIGGSEPAPTGGPDDFLLFYSNDPISQTDNFCFQCHTIGGSSVQVGGITNNDYGSTFGGGTTNSTNIKDAFNFGPPNQAADGTTGSSHNIEYVRNWTGNQAFGSWMTTDTNGCIACHDVHYAQRNPPVQSHPQGGVLTAVRRPSDVNNYPRNQWGDDNSTFTETVAASVPANGYQAPVFFPWANGKMLFEPANNIIANGSNLPNFVTFCNVCHVGDINSARNDSYFSPDRNLRGVAYASNEHGGFHDAGSSGEGTLIYPYTNVNNNYYLNCTDCHESHGNPNPFLLRTCVNGKDSITVTMVGTDWDNLNFYEFCTACHVVYSNNSVPPATFFHLTFNEATKTTVDCTQGGGCHGHPTGGSNL